MQKKLASLVFDYLIKKYPDFLLPYLKTKVEEEVRSTVSTSVDNLLSDLLRQVH